MTQTGKLQPSVTHSFHAFAVVGILLSGMTGCGNDRPELEAVSGRVLVDGTPADGAIVTLHAEKSQPLGTPKPFARSDATGNLTFTTYSTTDGVPAGEYRVTVIWPENPDARGPSPDRLTGRYARPSTTSLKVTIKDGMTELPAFKLQGS